MIEFGRKIGEKVECPALFELVGDVGAGKTTFVRGLAKGLGVKKDVTSPSFTVSKTYAIRGGGNLVHYDFYRLGELGIMTDDFLENLEGENVVVVEWGEGVKDFLPKKRERIQIFCRDNGGREVLREKLGEEE